jgi:hypothetical protein
MLKDSLYGHIYLRFQVLVAETVNNNIFSDLMPCNLVDRMCFEGRVKQAGCLLLNRAYGGSMLVNYCSTWLHI